MHRRITGPAILAVTVVVAGIPAGYAGTRSFSGSAEIPSARHALMLGAMTLDQAVALAERRYKARVVRADTQREGGRVIYVLRLLNGAGRVWTVRVDAQSGQMQ